MIREVNSVEKLACCYATTAFLQLELGCQISSLDKVCAFTCYVTATNLTGKAFFSCPGEDVAVKVVPVEISVHHAAAKDIARRGRIW